MGRINRPGIAFRVLVLCTAAAATGLIISIGSASSGSSEQEGSNNRITRLGAQATWTTVFASTLAIEGLTGDDDGHLYVAQRGGAAGCPVQRITIAGGAVTQVGSVPPPCAPSGLTFGADGRLYITGGGSSQPEAARQVGLVQTETGGVNPPGSAPLLQ